jgi:hypothetical protein
MNNKSNALYIFLAVGAVAVAALMLYLFIGTYRNIPITSLLPLKGFTQQTISPNSTSSGVPFQSTGKSEPSVQRFIAPKGIILYLVQGKFVTTPTINAIGALQADFIIDGDPKNHKIKVIFTGRNGWVVVGRSEGSFSGRTTLKGEHVDTLGASLKANVPVRLRLYPEGSVLSLSDKLEQKVMDGIIKGDWSIPDNFVLNPPGVGIIL